MGLKQFTIDFSEFSQENLVRTNYKTTILGIEIKKYLKTSNKKFVRLKDYFDVISGFAFSSDDYLLEGIPLIRIGDVNNNFDKNNMVFLPDDYKKDYSRFLLMKNDIIVSLTGEGKIKTDFITEDKKYLLNQRVGSLRTKKNINVLFFYYLLNCSLFVKKQFYYLSNGKTQLNISPFDLLKIKIPFIPRAIQDQTVLQIEPIEQKIKDLKKIVKEPQDVINEVFVREFEFNIKKFEELKKEKFFEVELNGLSKQSDLRFNVKHSHYCEYLNNIVKNGTFLSFGKLLTSQPQYGANETAIDSIDGSTRYIRITDINNIGELLDNDIRTASKIEDKYFLHNNDFLFARSGTVGRSFLFDSKKHPKSIFAGYFIKFNFNLNLLKPLFLLYYSKSFLFEIWKNTVVRLMGQPNINAEEYKTLPIIFIPLKEQERIILEIKTELDKNKEIKKQIEEERNKINNIITKVIS